jgi:hypothetical protein
MSVLPAHQYIFIQSDLGFSHYKQPGTQAGPVQAMYLSEKKADT